MKTSHDPSKILSMLKLPLVGCIAVVALSISLGGCAGDKTKAKVVGEVTVDGDKPVEGAIAFIPVDGKSPTAGAMIKNGKYSALVPFGKMKVEIRVPKKVGERKMYDTPDSPVKEMFDESLPRKYNAETELVVEITQGTNTHDFPLSTEQ